MEKKKYLLNEEELSKVMGGVKIVAICDSNLQVLDNRNAPRKKPTFDCFYGQSLPHMPAGTYSAFDNATVTGVAAAKEVGAKK